LPPFLQFNPFKPSEDPVEGFFLLSQNFKEPSSLRLQLIPFLLIIRQKAASENQRNSYRKCGKWDFFQSKSRFRLKTGNLKPKINGSTPSSHRWKDKRKGWW